MSPVTSFQSCSRRCGSTSKYQFGLTGVLMGLLARGLRISFEVVSSLGLCSVVRGLFGASGPNTRLNSECTSYIIDYMRHGNTFLRNSTVWGNSDANDRMVTIVARCLVTGPGSPRPLPVLRSASTQS